MKNLTLPSIKKFPAAKQRRLDALLAKNSNGTITTREKERLGVLVREAEELMVVNARRIAAFAESQLPATPSQAVPVTVWVSPNLTET